MRGRRFEKVVRCRKGEASASVTAEALSESGRNSAAGGRPLPHCEGRHSSRARRKFNAAAGATVDAERKGNKSLGTGRARDLCQESKGSVDGAFGLWNKFSICVSLKFAPALFLNSDIASASHRNRTEGFVREDHCSLAAGKFLGFSMRKSVGSRNSIESRKEKRLNRTTPTEVKEMSLFCT